MCKGLKGATRMGYYEGGYNVYSFETDIPANAAAELVAWVRRGRNETINLSYDYNMVIRRGT